MTFPFLWLPLIVKNEVIRSLGHKECIILVLASKRAAETVRMARIKTPSPLIDISATDSIQLWHGKVVLFLNQEGKPLVKEAQIIKSEELKKWTNQSSNSVLENLGRVYNEIKNIFRFEEQFNLLFSSDYKKVTTVKEVLSDPTMKNWGDFYFDGETIDPEELKMIMDMASPERSFFSYAKECPIDFRHENAFKFRYSQFKDARWVKIEDLYKFTNGQDVSLLRNNFTKTQIKEFISYWVNSEIDMFRRVVIKKMEAFDLNEIADGLTLLHIEGWRPRFTKATSSKQRQKTLLYLHNSEKLLILSAWVPGTFAGDNGEPEYDRIVNNKQGVIELLIEKKQLDMEWESADRENKQRISNRLRQLDDEIEDYGVYFVDGEATLSDPIDD
ncbi:hypothetical protein CAEBREN_24568 [Caenorhabditis brenneri]|uniref:F-box associated domain-containing protein n=1 Tax=Caenorhabditis brenneri TaxID=135651 RepID=G0NHE0_CAEBE|nr:hypothetical protein CAEBREN_24568 [Caenorhabditis brenneri]